MRTKTPSRRIPLRLLIPVVMTAVAAGQVRYGPVRGPGGYHFVAGELIVDNQPPLGFQFATSIAVSDDTLVVGQPRVPNPNEAGGRAVVYQRIGGQWVFQQTLIPSDAAAFLLFGTHVAIDGDRMLISAPFSGLFGEPGSEGPGALYAFERINGIWTETQKIQGTVPGFGNGFQLSGPYAIGHGPDDTGVFIYQRVAGQWTLGPQLRASNLPPGVAGASFGAVVAIHGTRAAVSSFNESAAYIFREDGGVWTQEARVTSGLFRAASPRPGTLALDDHALAIGIPLSDHNTGAANAGGVSVYRRSGTTWTHEADLAPPILTDYDFFGISVALQDDLLVVGSHFDTDGQQGAGAAFAFAFRRGQWRQIAVLKAPEPEAFANFGEHVALDGSRLLIAAPQEHVVTAFGVPGFGAVHPFDAARALGLRRAPR